ncbi:energy-coupling factor transporter ATPase [Desulfofalx alkaliphila]|uniref:energy-coupling factor transporter ATPase n=1 Tax=Desulfofalx alkaliphila TaxID=105483 RepID=UPI0004E12138|nr:energy-coupling factor transporter ATPase [Desulfofalx alkaliphila]
MWAIELHKVSYTHNASTPFETKALVDISLKIAQGQTVGIIGPTGSGKSTLIQHFNGLLAPQQGTVKVLGLDAADKKIRKQLWRKVGLVFQYPEQQLFEESVYKDIAFGPKNLGLPDSEIEKRVYESIDIVGIDKGLLDMPPLTLSGGMRRRVAIAGVMSMQPQILVLDEPTAGMDPQFKRQFLHTLKKLTAQRNITIIIVTHSMEEAAEITEQLIVLNKGKIEMQGSPREVFKQADRLIEMGLTVPFEVNVMLKLQQRGLDVPNDVLGIDEAVNEILKVKGCLKTGG